MEYTTQEEYGGLYELKYITGKGYYITKITLSTLLMMLLGLGQRQKKLPRM